MRTVTPSQAEQHKLAQYVQELLREKARRSLQGDDSESIGEELGIFRERYQQSLGTDSMPSDEDLVQWCFVQARDA